ncbi:MAG: TraB/GumN family protein [Treponema sp.]|nr:TraB/GumN family protein [Treponema sp.]MCL2244389.1 TraB/GumN family protein [Treponema sp.]
MGDNTITISHGGTEIKLVGTAHVSRESIDEVKRIICDEKPDMVCVELDHGRYNSIVQNDQWEKLDLTKVFKDGKGFLLIANLALASFQRRLGNELGVKPGEEMKIAIETAKDLGIPYSLCDREVQTTLRRAWGKSGLWSKSKLLASLLASAFTTEKLTSQEIETLKQRSELDGMMSELAQYLPSVKETLIDERDRYLAARIWVSISDIRGTSPSENKKIVAVIGAGHMQGIKTNLDKLESGAQTSDVSELDKIPPPGFLSRAAGFIIPAAIIALIAVGFIGKGTDIGFTMILRWVLWNGSLAALGSLIALAHPLAILVSFLGAPIATLNPLIGVGLFSGLVQIAFLKPRVSDVQDLAGDTTSLKGIYRNRITKALLVFFLSSLGGAIGNFISFPAIAGLLTK